MAKLSIIIFSLLMLVFALPLAAQTDLFQIAYGDTISDGVPGPGAGNIEVGGAQDAYEFQGATGEEVIFDSLVGSSGQFRWLLTAPDGTVLFDGINIDRRVALPQTGTYTLTVRGRDATTTGLYSLRLLLVPAPQEFVISIGDTVSDGIPAAGAGNLEVPGAVDIYRFDGVVGQSVIFDALAGNTGQFRVILTAPDSTELFSDFYVDRQGDLPQTGTYSLTVSGLRVTDFGVYSLALLEAVTNSSPVANDDNAAADEDTAATIPVLANDTDADGDPLIIESVTQPANGSVANNGANVTYIPNTNFNGVDNFTYTISDGNGGTDTTAVTVTVNPVNDSPTLDISVDPIETGEGGIVTRTFTVADIDGDSLTVQAQPGALNGLGGGSFEWSFLADDGPATVAVTITVDDGQGGVVDAGFNVTVRNLPPTATFNNVTGPITAPGSVALTFSNQDDPSQADTNAGFLYSYDCTNAGTFVLSQSTSPTFNCPYNTEGVYTARGRIEDKDGGFTDLFAEVVVEAPANSAPDAQDDLAATDEDVPVTIPVLANDTDPDGDPLIIESVAQPANGSVINSGTDVSYTPNPNFNGVDSFTYTISDGNGGMDTAAVMVAVNSVNDSPVSSDDNAVTDEGVAVTVAVLANDSDIDGDPLTVISVTQPANGSVINNGNNVTYAPNVGFSGVDSFTYTASDPSGGSATATVTVTVNPVSAPGEITVTFQVNQSSDDVNEYGPLFVAKSPLLWIGNDPWRYRDLLGLRFNNVNIPQGATIEEAYIEVYSPIRGRISFEVEFSADAVGNSPTFDRHNRPSQRTLTTVRAEHHRDVHWSARSWNRFDDIAPVIQEIIARQDWQSGNSLSLIIRGTGRQWGGLLFASYDLHPAFAPRLVVRYTQNQAVLSAPAISAPTTGQVVPLPTEVPVTLPSPMLTETPTVQISTETPAPTETAAEQVTVEPTPSETPAVVPTETPTEIATEAPTAESIQESAEALVTPTATEDGADG